MSYGVKRLFVEDVTDPQPRHHPQYVPQIAQYIITYLSKAKSSRNIVTQQKPKG